jgi:hypothetical protein
MRFLQSALLVVVTMFAGPASAQASADMSIEAVVSPAGPIVPGTTALITLTMRNLGPSDATFVGAISSSYLFLTGGSFDLYASPPNGSCARKD